MKHALLGASKAGQWINCPPSARLQEGIPDSRSEFAQEGTAAHELAETKLTGKTFKGSEYYNPEMDDAITEYVDLVEERFMNAKARSSDAVMLIEERVDYSDWVQEGFGTCDVIIIADGVLEIIDLKYGKGVPVSAVDNPQTRLYALGAWSEYNYLYDITEVHMTIIQPRLDNVSTEVMGIDDLLQWAEEVVSPAADLAFAGEGECKAGDHCRWCKIKATCRARADENMQVLAYEFKEPALLSDEGIGAILVVAGKLAAWAKDVQDYAYSQAVNGKKFDNWKLVEGRSNRTITDKQAAMRLLEAWGVDENNYLKPRELAGIGELEKVVGKRKFGEVLGHLIIKPPGKPVLVAATDKRVELNSIDGDFAGEEF